MNSNLRLNLRLNEHVFQRELLRLVAIEGSEDRRLVEWFEGWILSHVLRRFVRL